MKGLENVTHRINKSHVANNPKITSISDLSDNIKNNTLVAVNTLIKRFLGDVMKTQNPIRIHDTKELRDIITVYQEIEEVAGGASSSTPQINTEAVNFIDTQMREPHDSKGTHASIQDKLPSLNKKQVKQFFKNREKELDNKNLKKM